MSPVCCEPEELVVQPLSSPVDVGVVGVVPAVSAGVVARLVSESFVSELLVSNVPPPALSLAVYTSAVGASSAALSVVDEASVCVLSGVWGASSLVPTSLGSAASVEPASVEPASVEPASGPG